jgi:hypothetical protein
MEKAERLKSIIIVLCVIGFLLTIADFLALHDIHRDYIGTEVVKLLDITIGEDLPAWAAAKGEWGIVRVSYLFRFVFFILCAAILTKILKK